MKIKIILVFLTILMLYPLTAGEMLIDHPFSMGQLSTQVFLQDSDGFLWIGSIGGLFKYDGYNLIRFDSVPDSLSNVRINRLIADIENHISAK